MTELTKSSDEILTELFDSFKTEASADVSDGSGSVKSTKEEYSRNKKKHKKEKRHKSDEKDKHRKKKKCKRHKKKNEISNQSDKNSRAKKKKKRRFSSDSNDSEIETKLATKKQIVEGCNKENNLPEENVSNEIVSAPDTNVNSFDITCDTSSIPLPPSVGDVNKTKKVAQEVPEAKRPQVSEVFEKHAENCEKPAKKLFLQGLDKPKMSIKIGNLKNSQVLEAAEEAKIKADKYEEGEITDETSQESIKSLKIKVEAACDIESSDEKKKHKHHHHHKKCRKRTKSFETSLKGSVVKSDEVKLDECKSSVSEETNGLQIKEESLNDGCILEKEKIVKKSSENESSTSKLTLVDIKNQPKHKKQRQLRERKLDESSSEDDSANAVKNASSKHTKDNSKKLLRKGKRNSKLKSLGGSRSSSSSDSSIARNRKSRSREETAASKEIRVSGRSRKNSVSRKNSTPEMKVKSKQRKLKSRGRSSSRDRKSRSRDKKSRSSSRSKLRKSRSLSKSRTRKSRSPTSSRGRKSRSASRTKRRKSLSKSREKKSRSLSYGRTHARRSRSYSRSKLRKSRTPSKYRGRRRSRSASKQKKSLSPPRTKSKRSRSLSRTRARRSNSPSRSRVRKSRSFSRSRGRKSCSLSRSRGRLSRSHSRLYSSRSKLRRSRSKNRRSRSKIRSYTIQKSSKSRSRSHVRSISRNRSSSKLRHSRSENRRSRSKNKRSKSRESGTRSKQSGFKSSKGESKKEHSGRSSSGKPSSSKLSDTETDSSQSESDSKCKGTKQKKAKEKNSRSKKQKSKHKDINSRLLALSSTKVKSSSSSEDSSTGSNSEDSDMNKRKSCKVKNSSKSNSVHSKDKKNKAVKGKKDSKGREENIDSNETKTVKEVDLIDDSDNVKPKINLKQKIHYSLIDDEPIAMTESEMKILNAKNKKPSRNLNPFSVSSFAPISVNSFEKESKNKDKNLKLQEEGKNIVLGVVSNIVVKGKSEDALNKVKIEDTTKKIKTEERVKKVKTGEFLKKAKTEDVGEKGKTGDAIKNVKLVEDSVEKIGAEDFIVKKVKTENICKIGKTDFPLKTRIAEDVKKAFTEEKLIRSKAEAVMKKFQTGDLVSTIKSEDKIENRKTEEKIKNKIDIAKKDLSNKEFITKKAVLKKVDSKDSVLENELCKAANSDDSDGQRSDPAMRNMFFHDKSYPDASASEDENSSKSELSKNEHENSDESSFESNNEKTFLGISKDHVEIGDESSGFKTRSLAKDLSHSSDSDVSSVDKNITDEDESVMHGKNLINSFKNDSDSTESTMFINQKEDFPLEKGSCCVTVVNKVTVPHCNIQTTNHSNIQNTDQTIPGESKSNVCYIKLPSPDVEQSITLSIVNESDPVSPVKGPSISDSIEQGSDNSSDLSPSRTNSQDSLYEYEKSEMEDEKLDFDEDKYSESDVSYPGKSKEEDAEVTEVMEESVANISMIKTDIVVSSESSTCEIINNIQGDSNISDKVSDCDSKSDEYDVLYLDVDNQQDENLIDKETVSDYSSEIMKDLTTVNKNCDEMSSSNSSQTFFKDSKAPVISDTLDIPVPSTEKSDSIEILSTHDESRIAVNMSVESNSLSKLLPISQTVNGATVETVCNEESNSLISNSVEEKITVAAKETDLLDGSTKSFGVQENIFEQKVTISKVKSVSRSRSRSKIDKPVTNAERSKSRSRRETSSSRKSKSKDRYISRRSKSKEKHSRSQKGRSKSHDRRSHSKCRRSRSRERRRRSRDRRSQSGSGRSRSKEKSSRLRDKRSRDRRSRSRRRALSRSRRRSRSKDRRSRSRKRNRSRSKDKRSRSRDRRKRSRSRDRRSRSRYRRVRSRSRDKRSRSRRRRGRSQSLRDKRSRSRLRKDRSRTRSRSKDKTSSTKDKRDHERSGISRVKSGSSSQSPRKKSKTRSISHEKKSRSLSKCKISTSKQICLSRSCSKEKQEQKNNDADSVKESEISLNLISKEKSLSPLVDVSSAQKTAFSISTSKDKRSSIDKEMDHQEVDGKTLSSAKSTYRLSKEKAIPISTEFKSMKSPLDEKICRSRSRSLEKSGNDCMSSFKKSVSPDPKSKRSKSKSPDKRKSKENRGKSRSKSKDRSLSEVKTKSKDRKSRSRERKSKTDEKHLKSHRKRSRSRSKSKEKAKSRDKRSRSRERRSKSRDKKSRRSRSRSRRRKSDKKERSRRSRSRSKSRSRKRSKKSRSRSRSKDEFFIDKSKLLEIARKNALSMMKQGAVGTDLNKVTAITAGGKTVDELTDFCKLLSQKDATGQESVSSESSSENESEKPFHHPFQLKERSNNIIMNIRNCASLPVKTHLEKTTENAQQLRLQFPVSSGQLHRKSENEWIPVSPKKIDEPKAIMPAPARKQEEELPMYPGLQETVHFSNIPLPNSLPQSQHLPTMPQMGNPWPQPHDSGLFTGTTGARVLSQAELASGQQAWAKKDQLISAQPVIGGMGMSLLQKMGWKPGEGLGKRNEGTLEPLKLQVKMDKRGLVCADEIPQPRFRPHHIPKNQPPTKSLEGKHPVSLLVEYCTRKHLNPPMFTVLSEEGPAHKKNFVFKVTVNGVDYQPPNPSPNKKQAKSEAAVLCLRSLGLLPTV